MKIFTNKICVYRKTITACAIALVLFFAPTPTYSQTNAELQALINSLLARITELQAQIAGQAGTSQVGTSFVFTRNLTLGSAGADVTALQKFLIAKGFLRQVRVYGNFGPLTQSALAAYQRSQRITPVAGFFGPRTRAIVNSQISGLNLATGGNSTSGGVGGIGNIVTINTRSGGGEGGRSGNPSPAGTTECNDGIDNDSDGLTDFPIDPECIGDSEENGSSVARKNLYAFKHVFIPGGSAGYNRDYPNIISPWVLIAGDPVSQNPTLAKAYLDQFEDGAKGMFSWSMQFITPNEQGFYHAEDVCRNIYGDRPNYTDEFGVVQPYRCPWMDTWLSIIKPRWQTFFQNYSAIGGELDFLTMDNEKMNSVSGINDEKFNLIISSGQYDQVNTNFNPDELAYGPMREKMGTLDDLIRDPSECEEVDCKEHFSLLLADWFKNYMDKAMYEPIKTYFPNTAVTNFNDYNYDYDTYFAPLDVHVTDTISGAYQSNGSIFGTHQNRGALYDMDVFSAGTLLIDGVHLYTQNYFNKLKQEVNWAKVSSLSNRNAPLAPLFAGSRNIARNPSLIPPAGMYAETVFHFALAGSEYIQLWTHTAVTTAENQDLSYALNEFDKIAGFADKQSLVLQDSYLNNRLKVSNKSAWNDDYILTGMSSADRKVWRFTPDGSQLDIAGTLVSENPVTFLTPQSRIVFPEGVLYRPTNTRSNLGFWVVQPESAADPIISESSLNAPPVAAFTLHQLSRVNDVHFISYGSGDPDGTSVTIEYDFNGDGSYGDAATFTDGNTTWQIAVTDLQDQAWVSNYYTTGGRRTVGIKVTDVEGASTEFRKTFTMPAQACVHTIFTGLCEIQLSSSSQVSSNLASVIHTITNVFSDFLIKIGEFVQTTFSFVIKQFI